ncbi:MAG: 4-(cytidine 5'-diphospho)-2-C-methyl-D-erythritol kinase, partial [Rhodospirillaceae bacterium]|nr:4-(cytidine 5'-diphospho)-2-C-methyl-D-erythritol kinase [Rhodospirillaceae bacterium]
TEGGYHLLDSLVAFAGIHDTLTASAADKLSLAMDGPFAGDLTGGGDNLVLKAASALAGAAGVTAGAELRLTKRLPVSSGIGGGSADAAATLIALAGLWDVHLPDAQMAELALGLGADVPVCLGGRAAFMGGIGEDLTPAPALPSATLVLVNPGVALATNAVFGARTGDFGKPAGFDSAPRDAAELAAILAERDNQLTAAAVSLAPVIGDVLAALSATDGALLSRMSGSGATCFGLFAEPGQAAAAALALSAAHGDWWVKAGALEGHPARLRSPT